MLIKYAELFIDIPVSLNLNSTVNISIFFLVKTTFTVA